MRAEEINKLNLRPGMSFEARLVEIWFRFTAELECDGGWVNLTKQVIESHQKMLR